MPQVVCVDVTELDGFHPVRPAGHPCIEVEGDRGVIVDEAVRVPGVPGYFRGKRVADRLGTYLVNCQSERLAVESVEEEFLSRQTVYLVQDRFLEPLVAVEALELLEILECLCHCWPPWLHLPPRCITGCH